MTSVPYNVWKKGLDKWTEGAQCTEENYLGWWSERGCKKCSFCDYYCIIMGCILQGGCPLRDSGYSCAREYDVCRFSVLRHDFPTFHKNAAVIRDRIAALPHTEREKTTVKLLLVSIYWILFRITHPSFWVMIHPYSEEWDRELNRLLDENEFLIVDYCTAKLGSRLIWTNNYPYAAFRPYKKDSHFITIDVRPKIRTLVRAHKKLSGGKKEN